MISFDNETHGYLHIGDSKFPIQGEGPVYEVRNAGVEEMNGLIKYSSRRRGSQQRSYSLTAIIERGSAIERLLRAMNDIGLECFFGISYIDDGMVVGFDECCVSGVTETPEEDVVEFFIHGVDRDCTSERDKKSGKWRN